MKKLIYGKNIQILVLFFLTPFLSNCVSTSITKAQSQSLHKGLLSLYEEQIEHNLVAYKETGIIPLHLDYQSMTSEGYAQLTAAGGNNYAARTDASPDNSRLFTTFFVDKINFNLSGNSHGKMTLNAAIPKGSQAEKINEEYSSFAQDYVHGPEDLSKIDEEKSYFRKIPYPSNSKKCYYIPNEEAAKKAWLKLCETVIYTEGDSTNTEGKT